MLDWLGSVSVHRRSESRVELELTRATNWTGWAFAAAGARIAYVGPLWAKVIGGLLVFGGLLLGTLRRRLVFDRDDGLLRSEQRMFGIRRRAAIPLFHLRSVVVAAWRGGRYVAYVERRVGGTIFLDEARKAKPLLTLAEAVADVAELRLVYDATTRAGEVTSASD
ncbi:MAG TPA: hypothetical protein VGC41_23380 [Kofleriaceae bacterium]